MQLYDYLEVPSDIFLVMEYCNGGDLGDYLTGGFFFPFFFLNFFHLLLIFVYIFVMLSVFIIFWIVSCLSVCTCACYSMHVHVSLSTLH